MMQVKLEIGSNGYIIESNRIIINVTVIARQGEFYVLRMPTGGAIKLRRGRIFLTREEAEQHLPQKVQAQKNFHRSPYYYGH